MYYFYTYKWKFEGGNSWNYSMNVFPGEFADLVLHISSSPESRVILFAKEITKQDYDKLNQKIG